MIVVHEQNVERVQHADRWSANLVGTADIPTTSGFNIGIAEYHAIDFSAIQVHDDQEALYVISGEGEIQLDGVVQPLRPGTAVYVAPGVRHSTRRTGSDPVRLVYAHGAV